MLGKSPYEFSTASAIIKTLCSPNEHDPNLEPANVVDGLMAIARSIKALAKSVDLLKSEIGGKNESISKDK